MPQRNKIREKTEKKFKSNKKGDILSVKSDIVGWKYYLFLCKITALNSDEKQNEVPEAMGAKSMESHWI